MKSELAADLIENCVIVHAAVHLLQKVGDAFLIHPQGADRCDALGQEVSEHSLGGVKPKLIES